MDCIEKIISDFNAAHEGEYEEVGTYQGGYADILSKLTVGFAAGECPAVSFCDSVDTPQLIMNDMLVDLSTYAEENDPWNLSATTRRPRLSWLIWCAGILAIS